MAAQLVDGALGMAFGVTATSFMLGFGIPPAQASAMVHIAEIFTTAASGFSHWKQKNVDWSLVQHLAIPGMVGGAIGAFILVNVDGNYVAPFVAAYLMIMGFVIVVKAARVVQRIKPNWRGIPVVGFLGGLLDAIGGGGWGPIVTSSLIGGGHAPRYVIGTTNLIEFFVTLVTSATFVLSLNFVSVLPVLPLIAGGLLVAPFAGYLTRIIPARVLMVIVGFVILFLSARTLYCFLS